ncbi:cytokine receptor common subunit beta isoform X2 [Chelmon rostratus]|uniref:cytokine receptor common subunit beta isoform X2 n=1 Tax=Chelmon rostratus TaxID=109905 RepID=UPI001BEA6EA0|nr:cytokine receptor common subunit beta isoform X2 [Chelmon rostratus]
MMPLFCIALWSALPPLALFSGPDRCSIHASSSSQNKSPLLKSLQCYNDYASYVHCEWSEHGNTTLQLWFKTQNNREQCLPYGPAAQDTSEHRTVQCRYKTSALSIGIRHTVFFLKEKTETLCSSVPRKPLALSQRLRARPPVGLSTHDAGDGGRRLSWSSPYPSSSSLNRNITYQLRYRTDRQDNWTTESVTNTSLTLEKRLLLPGHRYEAKVRARTSVGQWSHWSPVATWQTEQDAGQFPSLHCVLDGEKEVMCSWEVSREQAHFITHQLACRRNQTAPSERCCVNPTVTSDLSGTVLRYSCSLTVTDPAHLLLELLPTRNAKVFEANQHIRPDPPQQVKVWEKGSSWIVEWTEPNKDPILTYYYQLCYYRIQDKKCSIRNISEGSTSLNILVASLAPSQRYQVKVRSLIVPGEDSIYGGIPSEWTDPVDWTSTTWSLTTLIYFSVSVCVAAVFLMLYCTIPACQRRVILWVESVPSPGKSKILSELKSATSRNLMQSENTSMCKVQHSDSVSTCSSDVSLWPTKDSEKKCLEQDEGCWRCDNQHPLAVEVSSSDTSSLSFSGPYILCQTSESNFNPVDVKCGVRETDTPSDDSAPPSPVNFTFYGEGYVRLPNRNESRSTQDLVSHGDGSTNTHRHDSAEQDQRRADATTWPDDTDVRPGLGEPTASHQPSPYTSGPFSPWPQGGTIQASGYCHLPTAHVQAEK